MDIAAFLPRPQLARVVVNHVDGNKKNNTAENLEYISLEETGIHAISTGLVFARKVLRSDGTIYRSVNHAARALGLKVSGQVDNVLGGRQKTTHGHGFVYLDNYGRNNT